jgi:hypothetical protein
MDSILCPSAELLEPYHAVTVLHHWPTLKDSLSVGRERI